MLLTATKFAELKKCSNKVIYHHIDKGDLIADKSSGIILLDTNNIKNKKWMPGANNGRPRGSKK